MKKVKAAAISMTSSPNKGDNLARAKALVLEAARNGADWIQLPEMFHYFGPYDRIHENAETTHGPAIDLMAGLARQNNVCIFAGTIGERADGDNYRVHNTSYVFNRSGELAGKYQKLHLFNLINPDGTKNYCEADGFIQGENLSVINVDGFKVGMSICYDLRFPELYRSMLETHGPLDVIIAPSAFTLATGEAHWELLLRARAVENQCYTFAANQVGTHWNQKSTFGHSMIVDPWGRVLANTKNHEGIAYAELDKDEIDSIRKQIPALNNRRKELFKN